MVEECVVLWYKNPNQLSPRIFSSSYATLLSYDMDLLDKQKAGAYLCKAIAPTAVVEDAFAAKLYKVWQYSVGISFWLMGSQKHISKTKRKLSIVTYRNEAGKFRALRLNSGELWRIPNSAYSKSNTVFINDVWGKSLKIYNWNTFHCRLWAYVDADLENPDDKARVLFDQELCKGITELEHGLRTICDIDFSTGH